MEYHIYAKGKTIRTSLAQSLGGSVHAFGGTEQSQISSESTISPFLNNYPEEI